MVVDLKLDIDVAAAEARIVLVFLHDRRLSVDVITCLSMTAWLVPVVGRRASRRIMSATQGHRVRASVRRLKCFPAETRAGTGDCLDFLKGLKIG